MSHPMRTKPPRSASPPASHQGSRLPEPFWKVVLDRVGGFLLLGLVSPLLCLIALGIKLTSKGPVFFRQKRVTAGGHSFLMWKFRTMIPGAERETGPIFATADDERKTPFGRFLRRFSLDELPQLWNVVRGEMSLVGPRPERPCFVEEFAARLPRYPLRHRVKAGITGWAQIHGKRGDTPIADRLDYDLEYAEKRSLWLDLIIILATPFSMIRGENAC